MTAKKLADICPACNQPFNIEYSHQKYCSINCAFWHRVSIQNLNQCWEWTGSKHCFGYGEFRYKYKLYRAHVFSYLLHGHHIFDGFYKNIMHKCDNPSCCNPDHLYSGTQADNMRDVAIRNRNVKLRKLTPTQVIKIKKILASGNISQSEIARNYGVTPQCIRLIAIGKNWRHL